VELFVGIREAVVRAARSGWTNAEGDPAQVLGLGQVSQFVPSRSKR
jgi:hypothetical protein